MKLEKFVSFRLVVGFLSFLFSIGLLRSIMGHITRQDIVTSREEVLKKEEERKRELEASLVEATSAAFIEKQAREKLGLVKPGDTVVLLGPSEGLETADSEKTRAMSNWEQWWRLFF